LAVFHSFLNHPYLLLPFGNPWNGFAYEMNGKMVKGGGKMREVKLPTLLWGQAMHHVDGFSPFVYDPWIMVSLLVFLHNNDRSKDASRYACLAASWKRRQARCRIGNGEENHPLVSLIM